MSVKNISLRPRPPSARKKPQQQQQQGQTALSANLILRLDKEQDDDIHHGRSFTDGLSICSEGERTVIVNDGIVFSCRRNQRPGSPCAETRFKYKDYCEAALTNNPYVILDSDITHCNDSVSITPSKRSSSATTEHDKLRSQGTVCGTFFSEGIHVWNITVSDFNLVSVGVVSSLGVNKLVGKDGCLPPFLCSLRTGLHSSLRVFTETELGEVSKDLATRLPHDEYFNCTISVLICMATGTVSFISDGSVLGGVTLGRLIGEHSVAIHLKSKASVSLSYAPKATPQKLIGINYNVLAVSGNPMIRWDQVNGKREQVGFVQALGCCLMTLNGELVSIITDRDTLRIVDLSEQRTRTVRLSVEGEIFLCGIVTNYNGYLFATDLWNQIVYQISPDSDPEKDVWKTIAIINRPFGGNNLTDPRQQVLSAYSYSSIFGLFGRSGTAGINSPTQPLKKYLPLGVGPWGICSMGSWIFITDSLRHCVYGWDTEASSGEVIVVAGLPGTPGDREGWGSHCRFRTPTGICSDDASLCLFVADTGNHRIVKILLRLYADRYEGCLVPVPITLEGDFGASDLPLDLKSPVGVSLSVTRTSKFLIIQEHTTGNVYEVAVIQSQASAKAGSFVAPLERIMELLSELKDSSKGDQAFMLDEIAEILGKGKNIYAAQMISQGDMDDEVAGWIQAGFLNEETSSSRMKSISTPTIPIETPRGVVDVGWQRPSIKDVSVSIPVAIREGPDMKRIQINGIESFLFDIFKWVGSTQDYGGVLFQVMVNILSAYGFRERLMLQRHQIMAFCRVIQIGYQNNPYHNFIHAADVMQTVHSIIHHANLAPYFSDIELLALFVSAAVHDYDHPGVSNQFLISTRDQLAIRYNDLSVLENYHVSQVHELFEKYPECDWTSCFCPTDRNYLKELMISLVLSTDMKQHFSILGVFKTRFLKDERPESLSDEDKRVLLKTILHASDISNPVKKQGIYLEWTKRVMSEFSKQGVCEKDRELPYSPFCEPDPDIPKYVFFLK